MRFLVLRRIMGPGLNQYTEPGAILDLDPNQSDTIEWLRTGIISEYSPPASAEGPTRGNDPPPDAPPLSKRKR